MEKGLKPSHASVVNVKLLFVCVGNSCRSQMAEALAKSMGFQAASAGTHPASAVAPHALTLLRGRGLAIDDLTPKSVDDVNEADFDMVISMGCGVACPAMNIHEDWGLDDPVGQSYEVYEQTAEAIEQRLLALRTHSAETGSPSP